MLEPISALAATHINSSSPQPLAKIPETTCRTCSVAEQNPMPAAGSRPQPLVQHRASQCSTLPAPCFSRGTEPDPILVHVVLPIPRYQIATMEGMAIFRNSSRFRWQQHPGDTINLDPQNVQSHEFQSNGLGEDG